MSSHSGGNVLPGAWDLLLQQFDHGWQTGPPPRLEDYARLAFGSGAAVPAPARRQFLEELVKIDLEYRCKGGQGPRLEEYLGRIVELAPLSLELIGEEYRARHCWGDRPSADEYLSRFKVPPTKLRELLNRIDAELSREQLGAGAGAVGLPVAAAAAAEPASVSDLLAMIGGLTLLPPAALNELILTDLRQGFADVRALGRYLLERDWLTPYQVNQLVAGRGRDLVLERYLVLDRLGEGAKGQVFRARHRRMNRMVALKVIRKELLADADVVRRFYQEIHALSGVSHPHIVHPYDAGPIGATHFLAMEYVDGTDLARLVQQAGPLPVFQACDCIRQAALGLQCIHERGLIHRDIKPANLVVTQRVARADPLAGGSGSGSGRFPWGLVKVLDLGLARLPRPSDTEATSLLTHEGTILGTPDFMAPEQALNPHQVDIRSDLYSLGCTFYYLLAGRVPFPGGTLIQKADRHRWEEPAPLSQLRPEVPAEVEAVVCRLMAKRPEDRYQTPGEAAQALAVLAVPEGPVPQTNLPVAPAATTDSPATAVELLQGPRRRVARRWQRLAGPALALAVVGLSLFLLPFYRDGGSPAPPSGHTGRPTVRETSVASWQHVGPVRCVSFSPDGQLVASGGDDGVVRLWNVRTGKEQAIGKGHTGPINALAFTADGKRLASASADQSVHIWDVAKGQSVAHIRDFSAPVIGLGFAFDGTRLVTATTSSGNNIQLWKTATSSLDHRLTHKGKIWYIALSPDGKLLASFVPSNSLKIWDLVKGEVRADFQLGHSTALVFSPQGDRFFATYNVDTSGGGGIRFFEVATGKQGSPFRGCRNAKRLALSPDGKTLAAGGPDHAVHLWDTESLDSRAQLTEHKGLVTSLAFSPDNKLLATGSEDQTVLLWHLDGKTPRRYTGPVGQKSAALALEELAARCKQSQVNLAELRQDLLDFRTMHPGSPEAVQAAVLLMQSRSPFDQLDPKLVTAGDVPEALRKDVVAVWKHVSIKAVAVSPDGALVISAGDDLHCWNVATGKQTPMAGSSAQFAPNGRLFAVVRGPRGSSVHLHDAQTRQELGLLPAGQITSLAFSPDGRTLATASRDKTIKLWDLAAKQERATIPVAAESWPSRLSFSPDGQLLTFISDRRLKYWDLARGQEHSRGIDPGAVDIYAFSPDGRYLAAAVGGSSATIWDTTQQKQPLKLRGFGGSIASIAFSPDGSSLLSAQGPRLTLFETSSGKVLRQWPGLGQGVYAPDGRHVVGVGQDALYILLGPAEAEPMQR